MKKGGLICTLDVQYADETAYIAADIVSYEYGEMGLYGLILPVTQAYIPGFFAFREGPLLLHLLSQLEAVQGLRPRLLIIDGHGIAHPRKMGLASWVGVKAGISTIGLAKDSLLPYEKGKLPPEAGSALPIRWEEETLGYALRTRADTKPVFVSGGHEISQAESLHIISALRGKYRIIDPMRRADMAARKMARERGAEDRIDFLYTLAY